ncbi:YgiQ family radical SAM protein [Zongyangia hominis]|uniref:YgiQ family radical SAM protein n=1 Tax=Zongyangia hominis TaxID=2763677 RepID=A0A926EFM0_9FIRM|nr:YgiQ family radical SAM protein [Zongyangia hominis]MBC8570956.1 YgiQ family radical SAM protein [Zongyangia hominis]
MAEFLPIFKRDMAARGWEECDFICVTGDAYVDHPSFGVAIISRLLESLGYRVGVIPQPNWKNLTDITRLGKPRYGFFVTSGNIDSMVAHYTVAKRKRSDDEYTAGGKAGRRPDRAVIVYAKLIKEAYPDVPVIIGGLEASLRRFAHYDYWDDAVRPSILVDAGADLISYGMGEHQTEEIARRLSAGEDISEMRDIRGTCYLCRQFELPQDAVSCASFDKVASDKTAYARACKTQIDEQDHISGKAVIQKHGEVYLVQNRPSLPLTTSELDRIYALDYARTYHPEYEKLGGVPGIQEVEFSIAHNRGCFGACNFCSIAFHQGRYVTTRSEESVLEEAKLLTRLPGFKGYIHDIGGPTANFRQPSCKKQEKAGLCKGKKCLAPAPCPALEVDHTEYLELLRKVRELPKVKKVFIRSGIRYDYVIRDKDDRFLEELVEHHVSGQLKVAPEHCSARVLDMMGKPHISAYEEFQEKFYRATKRAGKEQYLVPYLMSSHPGSTLKDAVQLALFLKKNNIHPEQVQDFYPTPGTVSTCMFYTGLDPNTMKPVYVPRTSEEKMMQRVLLQYFKPQNRPHVIRALKAAGREDLIGKGPGCLVSAPYDPNAKYKAQAQEKPGQRENRNPKGRQTSRTGGKDAGRGKGGGRGGKDTGKQRGRRG